MARSGLPAMVVWTDDVLLAAFGSTSRPLTLAVDVSVFVTAGSVGATWSVKVTTVTVPTAKRPRSHCSVSGATCVHEALPSQPADATSTGSAHRERSVTPVAAVVPVFV